MHDDESLADGWFKSKVECVAFYARKLRELGEPELELPRRRLHGRDVTQ